MVMQKCLYCEQEFMPPKDGCSHKYCSLKCAKSYQRKKDRLDIEFRKENGLSQKHFAYSRQTKS
jgi:hypothetical protein